MKSKEEFKSYSLKLPTKLKNRLDQISKNLSKPKSIIIREAIETYLNEFEDFDFAIEALEELKDGNYTEASKKIDKVIAHLKK
ncbi:ribbon-helix-helix domain-containing protein [Campylobacter sp. US33a]|uniref:Ribbon-helix-helix domain-containing protein n=1 Tax=Campylobacter sp. CCS1377 TaxID=3158229 RepID=A0AAU7E3G5_9BACT|nr:ribbon-helix-helix domain-containing protein [Campylobacter sp. US33a]MCW1360020.1 ribbon-helix-helix domain-containing protein [Campylobacter jejuni]TEY02441.1 ribbon-helix-helix domain-containing protein [Campylobacter sp. US33a]